MTGTALAQIGESSGDELVARMESARQSLAGLTPSDLASVWQDASAVEAAAKHKKSLEIQLAAAKLRLHAERRLGELGRTAGLGYSAKEWRDFARLAAIPRVWTEPLLGEIDLFEAAVEHQLNGARSHTAYSVYMGSLWRSAKKHPKYSWLSKAWDDTWTFFYSDPRSKRWRQTTFAGTLDEVLQHRAELLGRISNGTTKLLPIRGNDPLAAVLDSVRQARQALGDCWPDLTTEQKKALDGAYSALDDLAHKTVEAVNL